MRPYDEAIALMMRGHFARHVSTFPFIDRPSAMLAAYRAGLVAMHRGVPA